MVMPKDCQTTLMASTVSRLVSLAINSFFIVSANMGVPDDNNANYVDDISPRFLKDSGKGPAKEDDAESISLT